MSTFLLGAVLAGIGMAFPTLGSAAPVRVPGPVRGPAGVRDLSDGAYLFSAIAALAAGLVTLTLTPLIGVEGEGGTAGEKSEALSEVAVPG